MFALHLDAILAAMVEGLVVTDDQGIVECFNPAAERIFGYPASEVIGQNVSMLMPPPFHARHDEYMARYGATREGRILGIGREVQGRRRDGSVFPMELGVGAMHSGDGRSHFVGVIRDVSERRAFETAIANREAQIRLMFDQAPVGSFTVAADGRIVSCNAAFEALVGRRAQSLVGSFHDDLVHPEDRGELGRCFRELADSQSPGEAMRCSHDLRYLRLSGEVAHATLHAGLVRTAGCEQVVIGQVVDRSDQHAAEEELRSLRDRLAHFNRLSTMGEMASGIAHEINQPLTAISAYAQACRRLLGGAGAPDPSLDDALEQIAAQAQRAGEVIRRLRGFVRRQESSKSAVDLGEVLRGVVKLAEVDARTHEVTIEARVAPGLPSVLVDAVQIQQVVLNLLRNAMEAMPREPGPLRQERVVALRAFARGEQVVVEVLDRGTGLDEDTQANLFSPFYTTKASGMGMGLSICQSIITAHGGRIAWRAREGGGSCFHFALAAIPGAPRP